MPGQTRQQQVHRRKRRAHLVRDVRHGIGELQLFLFELRGLLPQAERHFAHLAAQQADLALAIIGQMDIAAAVQHGVDVGRQAGHGPVTAAELHGIKPQQHNAERQRYTGGPPAG